MALFPAMAEFEAAQAGLINADNILAQLADAGIWQGVANAVINDIGQHWDDMQYAGFDPVKMMKAFMTAGLVAHQGIKKMVVADLYRLAGIGAMRGTKATKILQKSTEEFKAVLDPLISRYTIRSVGPYKNNTVTLGRIMAMAPQIVCRLIVLKGQSVVPEASIPDVPRVMQTPIFACLIPRGQEHAAARAEMKRLHMLFLVQFGIVIKSKSTAAETERYQEAAINSNAYNDAARLTFLKYALQKNTVTFENFRDP